MTDPGLQVRAAHADDIPAIKQIAEAHKPMLGFVSRGALNTALQHIQLKCPFDNPANNFYAALGFDLIAVEQPERGRALNIWRLPMPIKEALRATP